MEEIGKKIDLLISAHEDMINSGADTKTVAYAYNKIAKLNQIKSLVIEFDNIKY